MWELDSEESWVPKNWCFWTVVLEKTLKSPLDYKIQPVHPKGDKSWVFIGRTHVEAETPILWPPHVKSWLIGKDPNAGGYWRQEETKRMSWLDGIINSCPIRWAWVWVDSGSWWWTGRSDMLRFMGSQRVGHDWATELNWMGPDAMIHDPSLFFFVVVVVLIFSFKLTLSLSSFTLTKRPFSSSLLSSIRVILPTYLTLLMFLSSILIPSCNSCSLAFLLM